jgi:type VI secretion system protein ImpE
MSNTTLRMDCSASDLASQLGALQQRIRKEPQRAELRIYLFQLQCVLGQWSKAAAQLGVIAELDAQALPMVQAYRAVLRCEALRHDVFAGTRTPLVLGDPQEWLAWLLQAIGLQQQGHHEQARELNARALEAAPAVPGTLNGEPFAWLADADQRLGPVLEAVIDGKYCWVPMHQLARLEIEPPQDLRDLVWAPATLTLVNGGHSVGFVPTRYPGSELAQDERIRLARSTHWVNAGAGACHGLGQRMLASDAAEYPLLEVRELVFGDSGDGR